MEKIFYANKSEYSTSEKAVQRALSRHFGIQNAIITKNENGKPFLHVSREANLFFSISHTNNYIFIVFSKNNIGIDAESLTRKVNFLPIIKKFDVDEQETIHSTKAFLHHWTAKEAAIKWLGGSIAKDLNNLTFLDNQLYYKGIQLPVFLTFHQFNAHLVALCSENRIENIQFESI